MLRKNNGAGTEVLFKINRDAQDIQDNPVHPCLKQQVVIYRLILKCSTD